MIISFLTTDKKINIMSKSTKPPQKTVYRDDGDGKFITKKEYEKADPKTVTKEKVPIVTPKKGK